MRMNVDRLPTLYAAWRERYRDRDDRYEIIDAVVAGDFNVKDNDDEDVENSAPNFIQVMMEDTAESASLMPTLRVQDLQGTEAGKKSAMEMERIGAAYMDENEFDLFIQEALIDLGAYGMACATVLPSDDKSRLVIERRSPRTCYPEPGHRPGRSVRRAMFARETYVSQLPQNYLDALGELVHDPEKNVASYDENTRCTIVEYFDDTEVIIAILYESADGDGYNAPVHTIPVVVQRFDHEIGTCPVVVEGRLALDREYRGQYDQVVDVVKSYIRLFALVIDYADQAVYSDIWVRDLVGEMPWGGGAFIELGPNGAIGRVPPAVSSLNIQQDLDRLVDAIHLGGRWPKARPGEIDQSQASAKFLESSAGMMNTAIRTYHMIMRRVIEKTIRLGFHVDKNVIASKRMYTGILRNQMFAYEYDPSSTIDLGQKIRVEYGLGLGRDPSQSAVIHIQYSEQEFISKEFVMENIEGVTDVEREKRRLDVEKFRAMMLAKLLQGLETGQIPDSALPEIMRAREDGKALTDIYEEYVVKPREEQQAQQVDSGLGGPPAMPGMPPGGPGGGGPMPPAPPGGADMLARMNVPAGPGGMLGTQVEGGPGA